jgi:cytochrome c oxidase subunit 2
VNNKFWAWLFGVVNLAALGLFIVAPFVGWWLPKNVSTFGGDVDALFYLILGITGFFYVLTEALLVYFMYVYASGPGTHPHPVGPHYAEGKGALWTSFFKQVARPVSALLHNQHRVELAWTLVPAVILLYIAFAQINTWAKIKEPSGMPQEPEVGMEVSARMFEWRVRYPVAPLEGRTMNAREWENWSRAAQVDDVHVVNEIHVWKGTKVKVFLKTRDVIHSFYLPNLRLKQDALPGKIIPVWFEATDYNTIPVDRFGKRVTDPKKIDHWVDGFDPEKKEFGRDPETNKYRHPQQVWDLACAELCGWGHYKMAGKLFVHKDKADYLRWLKWARDRQQATTRPEE